MVEDAVGSESGRGEGDRSTTDSSANDRASDDTDDAYNGIFGAFPYAARATDSVLCKSYVFVGGLAALGTALLFGFALVVLLGNTVDASGGTFTFVRAFFIFVGLLVVAPLVAPVLFVARRHRRGRPDRRFDATIAGLGYTFMSSLFLALLISAPAGQRDLPGDPTLRAIVEVLYALPRLAGLVPPLLVALAMVAVVRRW